MPTWEELIANGFKPTTYEDQDGVFLVKTLKASEMPHFSKHVVDEEYVTSASTVVVEVCPDNTIQLAVHDFDYYLHPVCLNSQKGLSLLRDSGYPSSDKFDLHRQPATL